MLFDVDFDMFRFTEKEAFHTIMQRKETPWGNFDTPIAVCLSAQRAEQIAALLNSREEKR